MPGHGSRFAALTLLVAGFSCGRPNADGRAAPVALSSDAGADLAGIALRVGDQSGLTRSILDSAGEVETPYRIDWSVFTAGPPMMEALAADAIDIGACGDTPPLFALAGGAPIRVVGALRASPEYVGLFAPAGSKVTLPPPGALTPSGGLARCRRGCRPRARGRPTGERSRTSLPSRPAPPPRAHDGQSRRDWARVRSTRSPRSGSCRRQANEPRRDGRRPLLVVQPDRDAAAV
jgi:hypothetical protein